MNRNHDLFVRDATADDSTLIANHRDSAATESSRYRGLRLEHPARTHAISIVAGVGESVFGSLLADSDDGRSWTITHVFVEPEAREVGLGDAMVLRLLETLRRRGAVRLESQAQPGNRALKNLFERHGLVAQTILVGRSID
jgi:ribosomal protein S18 acetylase RimI-like enzyme